MEYGKLTKDIMGLIKKQAGLDLKSKIDTWIKESIMQRTGLVGKLIVNEETMAIEFTDVRDIRDVLNVIIHVLEAEDKLPPEYIRFDTPFEVTFDIGYMSPDTQTKKLEFLNKITKTFPSLGLVNTIYCAGQYPFIRMNEPFIRVNDKFVLAHSTYSYYMN